MKNSNISINGSGMVRSGEYNKIVICGSGYGAGSIKANRLEVCGRFVFDGQIECSNILISGSLNTSTIVSKEVKINGKVKCTSILSETVTIRSSNDCSIDSIKCNQFVAHQNKGIFLWFKNKSIISVYNRVQAS